MSPSAGHAIALATGAFAGALAAWALRRKGRSKGVVSSHGQWAVRWATAEDTERIFGFVRELAEYEKLLHEVVMTREQMQADFEAGHFMALLCEPCGGGEPVGFSLFFQVYSTFEGLSLYLEDLYVAPSARGSGAGLALLQATAAVAASRDCARLQWQALDWNSKAVDFYKSAKVGARERIGDDGTTWLNFIMGRPEIARLAGRAAGSAQVG